MTNYRTNRDGSRNLADLRKAISESKVASVRMQGGQWIISQWSEGRQAWIEQPCHYDTDERGAIEAALRLDR